MNFEKVTRCESGVESLTLSRFNPTNIIKAKVRSDGCIFVTLSHQNNRIDFNETFTIIYLMHQNNNRL